MSKNDKQWKKHMQNLKYTKENSGYIKREKGIT